IGCDAALRNRAAGRPVLMGAYAVRPGRETGRDGRPHLHPDTPPSPRQETKMRKVLLLAAGLACAAAAPAFAAPEKYVFGPGHSQLVFTYNHLGFSNSYGMFSGFEGEIMLDEEDPANSSV